MSDPIQLEELSISAGPDDAERRRRERDELARQAAEDALRALQVPTAPALRDLVTSEQAGPPPSAALRDEAPAEPYRGAERSPFPLTEGARQGADGSVIYPPGRLPLPQRAAAIEEQRRAQGAPPTGALAAGPSPTFRMPRVDARMLAGAPEEAPAQMSAPPVPRQVAQAPAPPGPAQMGTPPPAAERASEAAKGPSKPQMPAPGRMDEGLPSEGDIGREEGLDVLRRIFGGIGNALIVGSGRGQAQPFRSRADALRQERARGLQQARGEKRQAIEDMDARVEAMGEQELARERLAQQAADRDASRELQARNIAVQERGMGLQERRIDSQDALRAEQQAAARAELERRAAQQSQRDDAGSAYSQALQDAMRTRIETYRATGQTALAERLERLFPPERLRSLPASSLEPLLGREGGLPEVHTRGRAGGGGGGGAGAPNVASQLRDARAQQALREQQEGEEILPGVRGRLDGGLATGEAARMRAGFSSAMGNAASLRRIGQLQDRYGGVTAAISREAAAAIVPELTILRGMVARLGETGTIQQGEVPTINAALPNPTDLEQMTFGTFNTRLQQWRQAVEDQVRADLSVRGVDQAGQDRAIRALWSGRFQAGASERGAGEQSQSSGRRFRVTPPEGSGMAPTVMDEARARRYLQPNGRPRGGFRVEEVQ